MERRTLGRTGLVVSAIGLGCLSMSDFYGRPEERVSVATIHRALDLGIDLLDTSDAYGPYTNELVVGRAIRGRRDEAVIATKFGFKRSERGDWLGLDGTPGHARAACEASLARLGTDRIDLYYLHCPDPAVPIEETVGAMAELVRAGKVRHLGLSNVTSGQVRRAVEVHPISAVQNDYSLLFRDSEAGLLPALRELGIGFVAFAPLARGLLTGAVRQADQLDEGDFRRHLTTFTGENLERNLALVEHLAEVAERYRATPAQIALAWLLAQGDDVVPIPGTSSRGRLEENAAAAGLRLATEEVAFLDRMFPPGAAAGVNQWDSEAMLAAVGSRQREQGL